MKNLFTKSFFVVCLIFFSKGNAQELALLTKNSSDSTSITIKTRNSKQGTRYYDNGTIKELREMVNNQLEGNWKYFYSNGQLMKEGGFKNNRAEGIWKIYDKKGNLVYLENYKNGIEQGTWKAFHPDGKLKIEGVFVKGKRQGNWKIYNSSGVIVKIITFEDDIEKSKLILDHKPVDLNFFSVNQSIGNY
ncbi:toxin-antitoxin system YwqK family antitoxin [Aquimarina sp. SS2-1]|uniref:toxin-antitoxin system YwqK family antitoxin n=1 Tax=Aquimarina besae TaxID=3342247 RepID=UPI003670FDB9